MSERPQPVIRLEHVGVTKERRAVLADVSLAIDAARTYSILGPSGAGKTTLLRLLNRLEEPKSGNLWFHGTPYVQLSPLVLRRRVAMVFQVPVVFDGSVDDNLRLPAHLLHRAASVNAAALGRALELAGLDGIARGRDAAALSVGEKQRLCIARALMTEPEVLLLDEPTAALDPTAARRLIDSIRQLSQAGRLAVIMVTHQPDHARMVGGEVILLVNGRVVERSGAAEFFAGPSTAEGRSYLDRTLPGAVS